MGRALLARVPNLGWSVSATTRDRRPDEVDGTDYHFVTRGQFEQSRDAGGFLESFEVYGQLKGTPREPVEARLAAGEDVLLEIDVQGALAVKDQYPDALMIFLQAPNPETQQARLRERGSDDSEQIRRRLATAAAEEALADRFDAVVVNDDLERAVGEVAAILGERRRRTSPGGLS